jgi:hypothetical protein
MERSAMMPTNDRKSDEVKAVIVALATLTALGVILAAGLIQLTDSLAPKIGDIISFPASRTSPITTASITADPAGVSPRQPCVLDVEVMRRFGGSVLIEAVQTKPDHRFRVHWAGARTSNSSTDCGGSADLFLTNAQVAALIFAAGGKGVPD